METIDRTPESDALRRVVTSSVADVIVREFIAQRVEHIFLNPGTDTAPVQESLLRLAAAGETVPNVVLCPHEAIALAAAHAHYAVSGRPQVVMVHVDVGTQNLGSMLHNAARANAAVVILAGRTPLSAHGEYAGGRDAVVHWMQDVQDQAGIVRPYVKHAADLASPLTAGREVARAFQVATSSPPGPVYLTAGRELLMTPVDDLPALRSGRHGPATVPGPDPSAARAAARALALASDPVIVTTRAGQNPTAVASLVALAELLGARVVDNRERMNFPSTHPSYVRSTDASRRALADADVLLLVDAPVPWVPAVARPRDDAMVIGLDADPVRASMPGWSFPVDINIHTDAVLGLDALCHELEQYRTEHSPRWDARNAALRSAEPVAALPTAGTDDHSLVAAIGAGLNAVLDPTDIVVEEATTNFEILRTSLHRTVPSTYFRSGGSGLGWGLAGALGVKLAATDRRVVSIVGDGAFLFGSPVGALWAMHATRMPVLTIVLQNGGYAASRAPVFNLFPEGTSASTGTVVGTLFDSPPNLAALAQSCHAFGAHVREESRLLPTLRSAIKRVDAGQSAVVVVHVSSPWI